MCRNVDIYCIPNTTAAYIYNTINETQQQRYWDNQQHHHNKKNIQNCDGDGDNDDDDNENEDDIDSALY